MARQDYDTVDYQSGLFSTFTVLLFIVFYFIPTRVTVPTGRYISTELLVVPTVHFAVSYISKNWMQPC
jgi:hypothetical protein